MNPNVMKRSRRITQYKRIVICESAELDAIVVSFTRCLLAAAWFWGGARVLVGTSPWAGGSRANDGYGHGSRPVDAQHDSRRFVSSMGGS